MQKIIKSILKIIMSLAELLAFLFFFSMWREDFVEEKLMAGSLAIAMLLMSIVSAWTVYGVIKEKKGIFLVSVVINIGILLAGAAVSFLDPFYEEGIYATVLFGVLAVTMIAIAGLIYNSAQKSKNKLDNKHMQVVKKEFVPYKAKFVWDAAAEEYIERFGLDSVDELSDTQNEQIYEYAAMPVIYLLEWLVRNDYVSDNLCHMSEAVKNGTESIIDLFRRMDYTLCEEDIQPEIVRFLNCYFLDASRNEYYGLDTNRFFFDYYEIIANPNGFVYCVDYSENDYKKLSALISMQFEKYKNNLNEMLYADSFEKDILWKRFNAPLEVLAYVDKGNPFTNDLFERIDLALNSLAEDTIVEMLESFDKIWDIDEMFEIAASEISKEEYYSRITAMIRFDEIVIFPEDESRELGFAVAGSADFEEEHGISATFRGGKLVDVGYSMDYLNPYSAEVDRILVLKGNEEALKQYNLNSVEVLEGLVQKGTILKKIALDSEAYFMSESAIDIINRCNARLDTLKAFGIIDRIEYKEEYDRRSELVPKCVKINGYFGDKKIFAEIARNW